MKNFMFLIALLTISVFANCQNKPEVQARLANYKPSDTIMLADFTKLSELSLSSPDYSIVGFTLSFVGTGGYTKSIQSKSNKITEEMKNSIVNLASREPAISRITFEEIMVKTPQNKEITIEPLVHKFKLK
jgi:hypothetical protein